MAGHGADEARPRDRRPAERADPESEETRRLIAQTSPDLVITDLAMPGMGGFELIARLRADPLTADTPILVLSDHAGLVASEEAVMAKPFLPQEVVDVVLDLMGRAQA